MSQAEQEKMNLEQQEKKEETNQQAQGEKKKKKKHKKKKKLAQQQEQGTQETSQPKQEEKNIQEEAATNKTEPKKEQAQEQPAKKKKNKKKKNKKNVDDDDLIFQQFAEQNKAINEKVEEESKVNQAKANTEQGNFLPFTEEEIKNAKISREQDNSYIRNLGSWKDGKYTQTYPPTLTISEQFKDENYPQGVLVDYKDLTRTTSQEKKDLDRLYDEQIKDLRKAAEAHRQVRKFAQSICRPGIKLFDFCEQVENTLRYVIQANKLEAGIGFPTGVSLNNVAAHFTPNGGDSTVLTYDDVVKFDMGTHVKGRIIDSAFTIAFNPKYDPLLEAVKEATMTGVKEAGIDARFNEIGAAIQEVMESHEITLDGKTLPIHCVRNLNGHSIGDYQIHAGKSVPIVKGGPQTKMEEGELYAIETFGTTGKGFVFEDLECSHYMREQTGKQAAIRNPKSKFLLKFIDNNFGKLAFCRRWLDREGQTGHLIALKGLVDCGLVEPYYPLCDVSGSYVSQYEHTLFLKPTCKEILSIGDDY